MQAASTSARISAAAHAARPAISPMSQNVPKCPTFSPQPAAKVYNCDAKTPIAVVNAMAAEEQRLLDDTYSGSDVHQEMSDRLAQLDQFLQAQEAQQ